MQLFHRTDNGQRGGLRAAGLLWLLGMPLGLALIIGFFVCR